FWVAQAGLLGIETGGTAAIAWDYGARQLERMQESLRAVMALALGWGIGAAVLAFFIGPAALGWLGLEPEAQREGATFLRWAAIGMLGITMFYAGTGALRGVGNTRLPMVILLVVNVVNAAVTWLLISGVIGIELGVVASGIGYGFACLSGGAIMVVVLVRGQNGLKWDIARAAKVKWEAVRRVMKVGIPMTLEEMQFTLAFLAYGAIVASLGTTAAAAHTIALRTVDLAVIPGFGLGTAATALVGHAMGAGNPDRAAAIARAAAGFGLVFMVVAGGSVILGAPYLAQIFTDDPEVVDDAANALRVFALGFPALALFAGFAGSLRGAGDVRIVLLILTVTAWGIRVPGAYVGAHVLGLGLVGAWLGATFEINVRALLVTLRYLSGKWKAQRV
ncbi:MAG: MATE family efflux transporter, partial [Tepidiformaceae bacterium]